MRKTSSLLVSFTVSTCLIVCCAIAGFAQNREKFVISAKAGGINAITGEAKVHSRGNSDWQQLSITDDLEAGDSVRTANDGRVENIKLATSTGSAERDAAIAEVVSRMGKLREGPPLEMPQPLTLKIVSRG